ncbi:MAG: type I-D CRISPR-associated helicase Cas3', partial [Candidatus Hodarchaeota archaeon]
KMESQIIIVEAPVGSGKSRIIRDLFTKQMSRPIILTYPTRILLQAQVDALKSEIPGLKVAPHDERLSQSTPAMIEYSGATLLQMARKGGLEPFTNRSDLLHHLFERIVVVPDPRFVMTPDVLHLIVNQEFYKRSERLQRGLKNGIFVFDEFHLYHDLGHFYTLLENLLNRLSGTIILLSATPLGESNIARVATNYRIERINFTEADSNSLAKRRTFNYELTLHLHDCFQTNDRIAEGKLLLEILSNCAKPAAVILDSLFRLRHLMRQIKDTLLNSGFKILEWTGERKQERKFDEMTILFGTAAIEVGVDQDFRTLIMEASQWASAVQRFGRVGRKHQGDVHLITRQRIGHLLQNIEVIERTEFEQQILFEAFKYKEPDEDRLSASAASEMFRGDNYAFALFDEETKEVYFGNESLFSRYDITNSGDSEWRCLSIKEKEMELKDHLRLPKVWREEIMLHDKVFPLWGVIKGRLANKFSNVFAKENYQTGKLAVIADRTYIYYRK